ncbi:MAG: hypothetical protein V1721_06190 [Pseudomonadota bacterium]
MLLLPITELDVQALVDSQLTWEEEKQVWRGIHGSPALEAYYRQIITQKKLIVAWWMDEAPEEDDKTPLH